MTAMETMAATEAVTTSVPHATVATSAPHGATSTTVAATTTTGQDQEIACPTH